MLKDKFPLLRNSKNLIYFDNSGTTLKPQKVLDAITEVYNQYTSNVFRGEHRMAERASIALEEVRSKAAEFIGANYDEIIFTSNATDSINKVSIMMGINKTDKIMASILEHHSNYLPWTLKGECILVDIDEKGIINLEHIRKLLKKKIRLAAVTMASNVTGNIQPVKEIVKLCHEYGTCVLVDATQMVAHKKINVKDLDCDYLVFSAHKMFGPSGVGVLYAKSEILEQLSPCVYGGGMVNQVNQEGITFKEVPYCFEAGTPPIENIIGFGAAIDFIREVGMEQIAKYENELNDYAKEQLEQLDMLEIPFMICDEHVPVFTFILKNKRIDIKYFSRILSDTYNIAVNAGYQCAQPLYKKNNIQGAIRISLCFYNTKQDIDYFIKAMQDMKYLLAG